MSWAEWLQVGQAVVLFLAAIVVADLRTALADLRADVREVRRWVVEHVGRKDG